MYGNHARGAKFQMQVTRLPQKLENTINEMCLQIPGFFSEEWMMYNSLQN
jgi:hypothetical protein